MNVDYASITLPKKELAEIHRGLLMRHLVENEIRREEGLEEIEYPKVLEAIENALGLTDESAHQLEHQVDDELWNFAWYAFTDEWAWFRARAEVMRELGTKRADLSAEAIDRKVEDRYRKDFERFVTEVDMKSMNAAKASKKRVTKK
ncbi:MAG TPA: hypothetical protein VMU11_03285 [Verrucomicrobiae bacterium]|nr:hypothetical protein [Verrucomicrobiae bacterium]